MDDQEINIVYNPIPEPEDESENDLLFYLEDNSSFETEEEGEIREEEIPRFVSFFNKLRIG